MSRDLRLDGDDAARLKRERLTRFNTFVIPGLRLLGLSLVSAGVLLHSLLLSEPSITDWFRVTAIMAAYSALSWYVLHLFYAELQSRIDLGALFLATDLLVFGYVIHVTGAERSWLFFIPLFRVADQTTTSLRRALIFAHLAPLSYLLVILQAVLGEARTIALGPELAKLLLLYFGGLYVAATAVTPHDRRRKMTTAIRVARDLVADLQEKSQALERSSLELRTALETQSRMARENAELYAIAQKERLRQTQIFDSTSDGIVFVSHDGRIEAANVRAGELLGFDPSAVTGVEMSRVVARLYAVGDGDSFLPTLTALFANPSGGGHGDLQQPATGRVFHWVAQPARDADGGSTGLTFTFQDVTRPRDLVRQLEDKSRLLEDARLKAEDANRAKGEFLANVSHEIRTPLSAIIGMSQHMLEDGADADMLRRIKSSAEALMVVIGDILDFSKIESRKLSLDRQPFDLRPALADVVELLRVRADEKNLDLRLELDANVPDALLGDAMRLRQVLINLIGNAIKFTDEGGVRLRVGVATELPGEVCLHFAVVDTGIGIPRDKQELVFEAFAQAEGSAARRYGGTGLGLSISARLVELMGGDIWVESESGQGSAFRFTAMFGLQDGRDAIGPASPVPGTRETDSGTTPLTVLIAEDEAVHRELLSALLRGRGHHVITATNGREALAEIERNRLDVALMDLQMPEMDGLSVVGAVRERERATGAHLPIIAMSASSLGDDPERCLAAGADRFVAKPVGRDLLFRLLDDLRTAEETGPVS